MTDKKKPVAVTFGDKQAPKVVLFNFDWFWPSLAGVVIAMMGFGYSCEGCSCDGMSCESCGSCTAPPQVQETAPPATPALMPTIDSGVVDE